VSYRQASATALPFEPRSFDGAYMIHVGMNIADKAALFSGVRRVLKPGGLFAIYDGMLSGAGTISYPVPWAATPQMSFIATLAHYRGALTAAGFDILKERDRRDFARDFFREAQARTAAAGGPPPLGIHILMKTDTAQKIANVVRGLDEGVFAPIELICRARSCVMSLGLREPANFPSASAAFVAAPSPLVGEGFSDIQRGMLGEG